MTEQEVLRAVDIAFQKGMEDAKADNLIVNMPNGQAKLVAYNPDPEQWDCYAILADRNYRYYIAFDKVVVIEEVYWDDNRPIFNFPNKYDVGKKKITSSQIKELENFIAQKEVTENLYRELRRQQEQEKILKELFVDSVCKED